MSESLIYDEYSGRAMLVLKIRIESEEWIYEEYMEQD
tara:strand:+ start:1182 stop:1292 length:111 start_codon:yes stop_codon:yes gene_type:complete